MTETNPAWQYFSALQHTSEPSSIDQSIARDEALDASLSDLLATPTPDSGCISRRFNSLCRNRLAKHINRRMIESRRFRSPQRRGGADYGTFPTASIAPTAYDRLAYAELVHLLRKVLHDEEVLLILWLADGSSYAELARAHRTTVSSVKSKVFRIRAKILSSDVARDLRTWRVAHSSLPLA